MRQTPAEAKVLVKKVSKKVQACVVALEDEVWS